MSHKKKCPSLSPEPFAGSVELLPPPPLFIEFIEARRLWGFPLHRLAQFALEENPAHQTKQTLPPQQLTLSYPTAQVILRGWRLELMIGPLLRGRIARIHAEKLLGPLVIEEAWVSEIHVQRLERANKTGMAETPAKP